MGILFMHLLFLLLHLYCITRALLAGFFAASMQHLWMAASLSLGMGIPTMAGTTAGSLELNAQTSILEKQIYYFTGLGFFKFLFCFVLFLPKKMSLFFLSYFLPFPRSLFGPHLSLYDNAPFNRAARTHSRLPPHCQAESRRKWWEPSACIVTPWLNLSFPLCQVSWLPPRE